MGKDSSDMDGLHMKKEARTSQRKMSRLIVLPEDQTINKIDYEHGKDLQNERNLKIQFCNLHPSVMQIPFVRHAARNLYSLGMKPLVALLLVMMVFTIIKAPYFGISFTGDHSMKYNTYVEAALHMEQKNDFTWYQLKYQADPVDNPEGIRREFGHFPLYEWGLFSTFKLLPKGSIETKTRIYTHFLGLLILGCIFLFLRYWTPTNFALLAVSLIAINPMISFATFVTVLDSMAILFTFISLMVLNGYFESEKFSKLFWAGIVFGIGNSIKYSMFLWAAPIGLLLMYYKRRSNTLFIRDCTIYLALGLMCIVTNYTSISKLPGFPIKSMILFGIWIIIYLVIYIVLNKNLGKINDFIDRLWKRKFLLCFLVTIALASGILLLKKSPLGGYIREFLTDSSILFNYQVYLHMFRIQFKSYMTPAIFWLGIAGLALVLSTKRGDLKNVTNSFLLGSIVYWIIAAKAMFIHNYYTMIIMIAFSFYAAVALYYIQMDIPSLRAKIIVLVLFALIIFPRSYEETIAMLGRNQDISEVNQFVLKNTNENDIILNESSLTPITIYTGRSLIYPELIVNKTFREEIRKFGITNTMHKYKIKYLFTMNKIPSYENLAFLYTDDYNTGTLFDRHEFIYKTIGKNNPDYEKKINVLENIVKLHNLPSKLKLEAEIGGFRFFSFVD